MVEKPVEGRPIDGPRFKKVKQPHSPDVIARLGRAIQYSRDISDEVEKPRRTGCPA
jgi:hypothetical protein